MCSKIMYHVKRMSKENIDFLSIYQFHDLRFAIFVSIQKPYLSYLENFVCILLNVNYLNHVFV